MTTLAVTACVLAFAICFPATCKGQYYWGAYGWRQYWQPSSSSACDRAYPARQTGGYVHSCRYYCSGLPVRYSFEQDGTPCLTDRRITGSCYAGRCQIGWLPVQPPVAPQAQATAASVVTTESSPLESQGWSWPNEDVNSQRCTRADQQVPTVRRSCRYICKGWPIRRENEADGTACQLSWWREGFCFRGHCQRNYPLPPVSRDEDNEIEGGKVSVRYLKCRNYKERLQVDGVVRSCKFVCKQKKKAFIAYEKDGTPCAALPGQTGFCDHGVCKAVETTAAPTEASQAPAELETEQTAAVVSAVTDSAPAPAATATTEEATATEFEEVLTTASSAIEEEPDTAAPTVRSPWTPGFVGVKCDRAYPPKVVDGRALKCRFLCRGYPFIRIGFEEDGTPCLKKKTVEGVCFNGNCKPLPPSTESTTTLKEEPTTVQSYVTEAAEVSTSGVTGGEPDVRESTDSIEASSTLATTTEGQISDATLETESSGSTPADVEGTSAATDSNTAATEGEVSDATSGTEDGASAPADVQQTSTESEIGRTDTEGEVSDAKSASESEPSATTDVQGTSVPIVSEAQQSSTTAPLVTAGEESQSVAESGRASTSADEVTRSIDSSTGLPEHGVTFDEQSTHDGEPAGLTEASESTATFRGPDQETVESSTQSQLHPTEAAAEAGVVSTEFTSTQQEDLESPTKTSPSDEADGTATATGGHAEVEITTTGSERTSFDSESSTQLSARESTQELKEAETEKQEASLPTTDASAGHEETDEVSTGAESQETTIPSISDVTSAPVVTTQESSDDTSFNTDDSVRDAPTLSGSEVAVTTSATGGASSDDTILTTEEAKVIEGRSEKTAAVRSQEDLTTYSAEGVTDATGAGTEAVIDESSTDSGAAAKESEKTKSTTPFLGDVATEIRSEEDLTSGVAQTIVVSPNTAATEVSAESEVTASEDPVNHQSEGATNTPFLNSPATESLEEVIGGTGPVFTGVATEDALTWDESSTVKATEVPVPGEAAEAMTAVAEPATVKIITTVTRKEIVRPIETDGSQPEATLVKKTTTTSVQTLPVSELNQTAVFSPVIPADGSANEGSVAEGEDVSSTDVVSSGPLLVITDFVQKTASSSKDLVTTPSVPEDGTAPAESVTEDNVSV